MAFLSRMLFPLTASSRLTPTTPVSRKLSFSSPSAMSFFFSRVLWPSSFFRMTSSPVSVLSSLASSDLVPAGRAGRPADCRCIMVKRILKRILVFSSVACLLLACLPSVSFAIDPVSGAAALAGAIDAYGMAYGVGTVYDVSSSSGVSSSFEGLWDDFSEYQSNAGSQFDYDSYIENYNQNRSLYGFEHSSGKFAAWSIDAESAEVFDQFWNWLLTGPAEMTRVDNEYFQFSQSQVGDDAVPIVFYSSIGGTIAVIPNPSGNVASFNASTHLGYRDGTYNGTYWSVTYGVSVRSGDVFIFHLTNSPTVFWAISLSTFHWDSYEYDSYSGNVSYSNGNASLSTYQNTDYYRKQFTNSSTYFYNIPSYASIDAAVEDLLIGMNYDSSSVGVKAYGNGYVNVPDPSLPDYEPTPLEIVTNIPWDSTYDDTDEEDGEPVPFPPVDVPLVVDDIISAISAEDYALEEDPQDPDPDAPPPAPSEVFVPLLPVGLPSFNFSFSGIWHYVREWVSSLGAWFTTLFTIWGALPYAMVVPVYATAVVVIVLGVYKRFFM